MFTVCNNLCHEENIYNLIKRPQPGASKPPMHVSRYACTVRKQAFCNKKGCSRTMGPANVALCPPENFLRKHSRAPISLRPPAVPQLQEYPIPVQTGEDGKEVQVEVRYTEEGRRLGYHDLPPDKEKEQKGEGEECPDGRRGDNKGQARGGVCEISGKADGSGDTASNSAQAGSVPCQSCTTGDPPEPTSAILYSELVDPVVGPPDGDKKPQSQQCPCPAQAICKRRVHRLCCRVEKPAVPPLCCGRFGIIPHGCKNYLKDNALQVIRQPARIPQARYVDQVKGTTYDWCSSGYPRKYVCRQDYGMVPGYIVGRKSELEKKFQEEQYASQQQQRDAQEKCRHLSETDRNVLIGGLKTNWETAYMEFQSLPLVADSPAQVRKKTSLEMKMRELEKDIQLIDRHNHIFLADANTTFYLA